MLRLRPPLQQPNTMQELIQNTNYKFDHAGILGYGKANRLNGKTEEAEYRIEEVPRSLVAPLPSGGRISKKRDVIFQFH